MTENLKEEDAFAYFHALQNLREELDSRIQKFQSPNEIKEFLIRVNQSRNATNTSYPGEINMEDYDNILRYSKEEDPEVRKAILKEVINSKLTNI